MQDIQPTDRRVWNQLPALIGPYGIVSDIAATIQPKLGEEFELIFAAKNRGTVTWTQNTVELVLRNKTGFDSPDTIEFSKHPVEPNGTYIWYIPIKIKTTAEVFKGEWWMTYKGEAFLSPLSSPEFYLGGLKPCNPDQDDCLLECCHCDVRRCHYWNVCRNAKYVDCNSFCWDNCGL